MQEAVRNPVHRLDPSQTESRARDSTTALDGTAASIQVTTHPGDRRVDAQLVSRHRITTDTVAGNPVPVVQVSLHELDHAQQQQPPAAASLARSSDMVDAAPARAPPMRATRVPAGAPQELVQELHNRLSGEHARPRPIIRGPIAFPDEEVERLMAEFIAAQQPIMQEELPPLLDTHVAWADLFSANRFQVLAEEDDVVVNVVITDRKSVV